MCLRCLASSPLPQSAMAGVGGHLTRPPLLSVLGLLGRVRECPLVFSAFFHLLCRVDPVQQLYCFEVYGFDCCLQVPWL